MKIIRKINDLKEILQSLKNKKVGFVPTMGYIHKGHLSLLEISKKQSDFTIATLFVNKAQFAAHEDLSSYPRDEDNDLKKFDNAGVDLVFIPKDEDIYPKDFSTYVSMGNISLISEGKLRPQFFNGIATVLTKFFMLIQPDITVFSEKDLQQLFITKKLIKELNIPVEVIPAPTIREKNGLAMSSRNSYLSEKEMEIASYLYKELVIIKNYLIENNNFDIDELFKKTEERLINYGFKSLDYLEVRESNNFRLLDKVTENSYILISATLGKTRLLDNIAIR